MSPALYIYAAIDWSNPFDLAHLEGIDGSSVTAIPVGEIAAMVTTIPSDLLSTAAPEDLARFAQEHQAVNQALLERTALVPLTFGTVAANSTEIQTMLARATV
ncbi:MAG: hypothetical protein HN348_11055 [Proteobacteria bacterium]|jgi:hypothetical protein|nr:hypothetical protein [Pseudomonadota bacterium]